MHSIGNIYFDASGRLGRLAYFGYSLLGIIFLLGLQAVLSFLLGRFAVLAIYLLALSPCYCLMAKRMQDFNRPGTGAAIILGVGVAAAIVSLVNTDIAFLLSIFQICLSLVVLVAPGTDGPNRYGVRPR